MPKTPIKLNLNRSTRGQFEYRVDQTTRELITDYATPVQPPPILIAADAPKRQPSQTQKKVQPVVVAPPPVNPKALNPKKPPFNLKVVLISPCGTYPTLKVGTVLRCPPAGAFQEQQGDTCTVRFKDKVTYHIPWENLALK